MKKINAFILFSEPQFAKQTVEELKKSPLIHKIYLLTPSEIAETIEGCKNIEIDSLQSSETVRKIAGKSNAEYSLIYTKSTVLKLGYFALERMVKIADDSRSGLVYADYYEIKEGAKQNHPVIDYQEGSLRDDFNFGSLLIYKAEALKKAAKMSPAKFLKDTKYNFELVHELFNATKNAEEIIRLVKGGRKLVRKELEKGKDSQNVKKITHEIMEEFYHIELPIEWETD